MTVLRWMTHEDARELLNHAWWSGKNANQRSQPKLHFISNEDCSGCVEVMVPLNWINENEAGDRYDGTVDRDRMIRYAKLDINTPVYLLFGARTERLGRTHANVMDGGHRVSAARCRGDTAIKAIMQKSHLERLMRARQA